MDSSDGKYSGNIKIFTCNGHKQLAADIAKELGLEVGLSEVSTFSDGEISLKIGETIRGADVYIIQPTSPPVNDNIMELLIMIDAMRRASAGRITAVIPYFGYARQDRKARSRDPISAKLVANLLTTAGVSRVLTMDLHCSQIQGFFDIPVDHLQGVTLLTNYFKNKFSNFEDVVVVSPDFGSITRVRNFAKLVNAPIAIIDKRRPRENVSEIMNIIGEIEGKTVILVDDMIDTAGTITNAANALTERGAKEVYACCTHAILSGPAVERIQSSSIKELVYLDTVVLDESKKTEKMVCLSVSPLFATAIHYINTSKSISVLF